MNDSDLFDEFVRSNRRGQRLDRAALDPPVVSELDRYLPRPGSGARHFRFESHAPVSANLHRLGDQLTVQCVRLQAPRSVLYRLTTAAGADRGGFTICRTYGQTAIMPAADARPVIYLSGVRGVAETAGEPKGLKSGLSPDSR